jgi:hypothetical protein
VAQETVETLEDDDWLPVTEAARRLGRSKQWFLTTSGLLTAKASAEDDER